MCTCCREKKTGGRRSGLVWGTMTGDQTAGRSKKRWKNRRECMESMRLKIKCVMSLKKKNPMSLAFHFPFPWTIKCCSTHLPPFLVSHTDQVGTHTLNVCCEVPVISSSCSHRPQSHMLSGGTQRGVAWKWHLELWKNRVAQWYSWWKALQNLRQIENGWILSFQRYF